ncbi:MAG: Isoaspartyl peptidase precursor [Bacteroidetes bacterium ADurb.Bin408]|nr:MAG: Isoaspartyl peptidase precursor [Bacteroidetes bacterium ADurb.Bin408]
MGDYFYFMGRIYYFYRLNSKNNFMSQIFIRKQITLLLTGFCVLILNSPIQSQQKDVCIALHGGAGNISKATLTEEEQNAYKEKMVEALKVGYEVLKNGGSSVDAVEKAIRVLEDSPLFNAGKGAVYTANGTIELDASVMCGKSLKAGAVAGVTIIRNPISAAIKVMTLTPHVMLIGKGAEDFALAQKLDTAGPSYFYDEKRWLQYLEKKEKGELTSGNKNIIFGTVGVVAMDKEGNLAAGTSTGGMSYKKNGRVGDSPIIGAGTYADNRYGAVSCTGHGEFFIRNVVAYDIIALKAYKGWSIEKAARYVICDKLKKQGADGGVICIDSKGNISASFNTSAMFRGYINKKGEMKVDIF